MRLTATSFDTRRKSATRIAHYVLILAVIALAILFGTNPKASFKDLWKVDWTAIGALATLAAALVAILVGLAPLRAQRSKEARFLRMLMPAFLSELQLAAVRAEQAYQYFYRCKEMGQTVKKADVERFTADIQLPLVSRWCEHFAGLPGDLGALLVNAVGTIAQSALYRTSYGYDFPTFVASDFETLMRSLYPNLAVCVNELNAELKRVGWGQHVKDDLPVELTPKKHMPIEVPEQDEG